MDCAISDGCASDVIRLSHGEKAMTNTDLARLLLRDVAVHCANEKHWKAHDTGFQPFKRRTTDANKHQGRSGKAA